MASQFQKSIQYQAEQEIAPEIVVEGNSISGQSLGFGRDSNLANDLRNQSLRE